MADQAKPLDVTQLVVEHHQAAFRYAYRLTGSTADAEDLCQQAFLAAHQKWSQLREPANARGWLFAILRNCYLKALRRPTAVINPEVDVESLPAQVDEQDIDREQLQAVLGELPDEFKLVILMFYFEEFSYRQIAQELNVPIGTVMSRLSRAKSHLRKRLFARAAGPVRTAEPVRTVGVAHDGVAQPHQEIVKVRVGRDQAVAPK